MIALLLAAAVIGLLMAENSSSSSSSSPTAPPVTTQAAVQSDMLKLQTANPTAFAAVNQVLQTNSNPATIAQYAAQLYAQYPDLSKALSIKFLAVVTKVTGKSGTDWYTWSPGTQTDGAIVVNVYLQAQPILSYSQPGTNQAGRTLLGVDSAADSATVARARQDFAL